MTKALAPLSDIALVRADLVAGIARMGQNEATSSTSPCGADKLKAEITWDLVMSEDMAFAEGCYRIEGGDWQVVTAVKASASRRIGVRRNVRWESGVTGINIVLPEGVKINASSLLRMMSNELCVTEWHEVRGPDSMMLR